MEVSPEAGGGAGGWQVFGGEGTERREGGGRGGRSLG